MERAVPQVPSSQPVYDLPTFLETSHPNASVHPRNPAYNWRRWAAAPGNLRVVPLGPAAGPQVQPQAASQWDSPDAQLSLLTAMDAHMALPASRAVITRIAKLELAHLWYYQQQASLRGGQPGSGPLAAQQAAQQAGGAGEAEAAAATAADAASSGAAPSAIAAAGKGPAAAAAAEAAKSGQSPSAAAAAKAAISPDEDIFAAADRIAAAEAETRAQRLEAEAKERAHMAIRNAEMDPLTLLGPDVRRRVELLLRARGLEQQAAAGPGPKPGRLKALLEPLADRQLQRRLPRDLLSGGRVAGLVPEAVREDTTGKEAGAWMDGLWSRLKPPGVAQKQGLAADEALGLNQDTPPALGSPAPAAAPSAAYWAETPLLGYTDTYAAMAAAEGAARRAAAEAGPDGAASLSAAVSSLSAALPRPGRPLAASPPPTPLLGLLTDYLALKYQDLLHAWEVAAQLAEATEREAAASERERAVLPVQVGDPVPPALLAALEASWPSGAGLSWQQARQMLGRLQAGSAGAAASPAELTAIAAAAAAADAAAAAGDLRGAAAALVSPLLSAAAARHRALLQGDAPYSGGAGAAAAPLGLPTASAAAGGAEVSAAAASVVCFRETLVLDASSGFEGGSFEPRVTLEFSPQRLAALEPALGGRWGRRMLERLLAPPAWADPRDPAMAGSRAGAARRTRGSAPQRLTRGSRLNARAGTDGAASMAGRRRHGAAARSAAMAALYPLDVEHRFCRRTGTAFLSTSRYGSREANRKLLLEHYAQLLRIVAAAAGRQQAAQA